MTAVIESHIEIDENRVAWIADTKVKVIEVALDKLAAENQNSPLQKKLRELKNQK